MFGAALSLALCLYPIETKELGGTTNCRCRRSFERDRARFFVDTVAIVQRRANISQGSVKRASQSARRPQATSSLSVTNVQVLWDVWESYIDLSVYM